MLIKNSTLFCVFSAIAMMLSAEISEAPRLLHVFFKRLTETQMKCRHLELTTKLITTNWGVCTIGTNEIVVTIDGEEARWEVPGGPWTIHYYPDTDVLIITPQYESTEQENTYLPIDAVDSAATHQPLAKEAMASSPDVAVKSQNSGSIQNTYFPVTNETTEPQDEVKIQQSPEEKIAHYCIRYIKTHAEELYEKNLYEFLAHARQESLHYQANWDRIIKLVHDEIDPYLHTLQHTKDYAALWAGCTCLALSPFAIALAYMTYCNDKQKNDAYHAHMQSYGKDYYDLRDAFFQSYIATLFSLVILGGGVERLYTFFKPENTERFRRIERIRSLLAR